MLVESYHSLILGLLLVVSLCSQLVSSSKECEVCIGVLNKVNEKLGSSTPSKEQVEAALRDNCESTKIHVENRFCYYVGALPESATTMMTEISRPWLYPMPIDAICNRINKKDTQICQLRYEEQIDLCKTNLKTLKVKDLKKILGQYGEICEGCIEKSDYIRLAEKLKPDCSKQEL